MCVDQSPETGDQGGESTGERRGERVQEVTCDGLAHGGEAVGRLADGRVVFVPYAIPGERVRLEVTDQRRRFSRARLLEVLEPSPDRVVPPCPHFGQGRCGGCAWQHIDGAAQAGLKQRLVVEQLAHIAHLSDVPVRPTLRPQAPGSPEGYGYRERATLTAAADGRLGFLRQGTHDVHPVDRCPLLAPGLGELPGRLGRHPEGARVRLRRGADGKRMVVLEAAVARRTRLELPDDKVAWAAVQSNGKVREASGQPFVVEGVAGATFHVSAASFFQVHRAGTELLVELVGAALDPRPGDLLVDLYAGVGLFAGTVGRRVAKVVAIESWKPAALDAERNLRAHPAAKVVADDVIRGLRGLQAADLVVADPPRAGAGAAVVRRITALRPRAIALVSCDPAALARDLRAFVDAGYRPAWVQPVDLFPQTAHVEAVTALDRVSPG